MKWITNINQVKNPEQGYQDWNENCIRLHWIVWRTGEDILNWKINTQIDIQIISRPYHKSARELAAEARKFDELLNTETSKKTLTSISDIKTRRFLY